MNTLILIVLVIAAFYVVKSILSKANGILFGWFGDALGAAILGIIVGGVSSYFNFSVTASMTFFAIAAAWFLFSGFNFGYILFTLITGAVFGAVMHFAWSSCNVEWYYFALWCGAAAFVLWEVYEWGLIGRFFNLFTGAFRRNNASKRSKNRSKWGY